MLNREDIQLVYKKKSKSVTVSVVFLLPLNKETVSKNALVLNVLSRGTANYPTMRKLNMKLDSLYGAEYSCGIDKIANLHRLEFNIEFLNEKFVLNGEDITLECVKLLNEIITNPYLKDGLFNVEYIEREKTYLKEQIESIIDEKRMYSIIKCETLTCKGEPYETSKYGDIDDIDKIGNEELYEHYKYMFKNAKVYVGVCGELDDEIINKVHKNLNVASKDITVNHITKIVPQIRKEVQEMNVSQAKLCIGYKVKDYNIKRDQIVAMMYNALLGTTPSSKLFQNVREKASLAYYARSNFYKDLGMMIISTGIESKNYEKSLEIIDEQINDMRNGNITDEEMKSAKMMIANMYKEIKDNKYSLLRININSIILVGESTNIDEMIENINNITVNDVVEFAKNVTKQSVYFLKGGTDE